MDDNKITDNIIHYTIKVHKALGPGLLESAYKECLFYELKKNGLKVEKEKALPLIYEDVKMDCGYRIDLYVEDKIVIEIKSVDALNEVHMAQILTYLKLNKTRIGLLINFNVTVLKDGLRRVVNGYTK
jgi:GxxExxY protein